MNEGVWMGDKEEKTLYVNKKFCDLTGFKPAEVRGRKSYAFFDKESAARVRQANERERKRGISSSYEGVLIGKKGNRIPVLITGMPNPEGGTVAILTDLSALKEKESLYRKLVENMDEAVWMGDKEEKTVYANPKFCSIIEYPLNEMIGKQSYDFFDEDSRSRIKKVNETHRKKGISSGYEGNLLTKNGKKIPVYLMGSPLPDGGTIGIMVDLRPIKQQQSLYRTLVEHLNEAVLVCDSEASVIYVNPKFCALTGYKLNEVLGRSEYDLWSEESRRHIRYVNENERTKGISSSYEAFLLKKNGEEVPVLSNGVPHPAGGTIAILTDLTELKRKESLYRTLVENMNEGVWMLDKNNFTLYANPRFYEMTGYKLEELKKVSSMIHWTKESQKIINEHNKLRRKNKSSNYECTLLSKNGEKIPVLVSGTPAEDGGTMGIITDLRDLKKKEERENVLNRAITYANDAIIIVSGEGVIEMWNIGARTIFGYDEEEIIGESIFNVFEEEDSETLLKASKTQRNIELKARHKNRHRMIISATLTPLRQEREKTPRSFLIIGRDVTLQQEFEKELKNKYQKIKDAYNTFGIVRREMDYIFELVQMAREQNDLRQICDYVVNAVIMLSKADGCILRIYNEKKDTIDMVSSFGVNENWKGKAIMPFKDSLVEKAIRQNRSLKIIDITSEPLHTSDRLARMHRFSSLLLIPLLYRGNIIGSLSLYVVPEKRLKLFENDFVEEFAKLVALVLATVRKKF